MAYSGVIPAWLILAEIEEKRLKESNTPYCKINITLKHAPHLKSMWSCDCKICKGEKDE